MELDVPEGIFPLFVKKKNDENGSEMKNKHAHTKQ